MDYTEIIVLFQSIKWKKNKKNKKLFPARFHSQYLILFNSLEPLNGLIDCWSFKNQNLNKKIRCIVSSQITEA